MPREQTQKAARWEHFSHRADIGIRGIGATKEQAFEQAAVALSAAVAKLKAVRPERKVDIECSGAGDDELLFEWLNALVYEMATRKMLFSRFEVRFVPGGLRAAAWGEPVDRDRHQPAAEAKGATYTELAVVERSPGAWVAQCVVDV